MISANHRSLLDPVIVHVALPGRRIHCLATKDLYNTKLKRAFFNQMHCIMVDKENFSVSAFHDVVTRLKGGHAVAIFPEGQVNTGKDETIKAFKSGAVLMSYKANASILPIYIVKRDKWYQRQRIVIGRLFDVREAAGKMPSIDQIDAISEALREEELQLCEYFENLPIFKKLSKKTKNRLEKTEKGEQKIEQEV